MRDTTWLRKGGKERSKNEKKYAPYKLFSQPVNKFGGRNRNKRAIHLQSETLLPAWWSPENFRSRESKFDKIVDFRFNVGNPL